MKVIFRVQRAQPGDGVHQNAPSFGALCLSGLLHGVIITAAFLGGSYFPTDRPATLYEQIIAPEEKKIVWYPLQEMRTIVPTQRIGTAPTPQGLEKKSQTVIREDPEAKPGKQLIWHPDSQKKIEREIPAPNLVAVEAPPAPSKPHNVFHLPDAAPMVHKTLEALPAPPVPVGGASQKSVPKLPGLLAETPRVTRPFVPPPPPVPHRLNPDSTIEPPAAPAGDLKVASEKPYSDALDSVIGKASPLPRRQFVPPQTAKGSGSASAPGKLAELADAPSAGGVNAAVLSTAPLDKLLTSIPEGSRSVQMSAAPTLGQPASGPVKNPSGLQIPGVAVAGGIGAPAGAPPAPAAKLPPRPTRTVYEETGNAIRRGSFSAPLRPSSRIIPKAIESRFHDRVVYTMIIAKPRLPVYAGDWQLWFAEKRSDMGNGPQMRAPQPVRKVEAQEDQPDSALAGRVQFAATIMKNGQVDSIVVLAGAVSASAQAAAIRDLRSWQFAPALRDGEAVDVEVVLEIPFTPSSTSLSTGTVGH